mgnify:CR=1 FL=1
MSNFNSVKEFMRIFGQEIKDKPGFPSEKIEDCDVCIAPRLSVTTNEMGTRLLKKSESALNVIAVTSDPGFVGPETL